MQWLDTWTRWDAPVSGFPANEWMHLLRRLAAHPFSWLIRVLVTWVIVLCMGVYPVDIVA